ncbi:MAG: NUDIX hydrolase [Oscillospiraceae bacterium]|jgi:8-oxo-dGTP diphosphatase|nr:NUDIX hydrolase [Oscillospiraceae bacterium]
MITLAHSAGAFLRRGDEYLLMLRAPDRKFLPDTWSNIGGGVERDEYETPRAACLREIEEETGITAGEIRNLRLRYIVMRRAGDYIRQNYVYFGETDAEPSIATVEGTVHWVPESQLLDRKYSATFRAMLEHYLRTPDPARVVVGAAGNDNGKCRMVWAAIEDFEGATF